MLLFDRQQQGNRDRARERRQLYGQTAAPKMIGMTKKERKQESDMVWDRFLKLCDDAICGVHRELQRLAVQMLQRSYP